MGEGGPIARRTHIMLPSRINVEEIREFVGQCGPGTKLYIGCDSERLLANGRWHADYVLAAVVHINGNRGCRIFGSVTREPVYDQRKDKPQMRLMNEVYKVSELYLRLADAMPDYPIDVHLDINPDERHGSSCVVQQAIGYIRGTCNVIPFVKPDAFAASYAADRLKDLRSRLIA
jgi:predicted RNase H-related nuclease YkuK (DUF458 family)